MADLFVSLVALVPKPATVTTTQPKAGGQPTVGITVGLQSQQVRSPGSK